MHKTKVLLPDGGFHMAETPVKPFIDIACLVLKQMKWQDRGYVNNYQKGTTIMLTVTPANMWSYNHTFIPSRFHYGTHFIPHVLKGEKK